MTFRGDERAATVQVGAVLLFGIIVISMSMYQASVVPAQNEQVEFQHSQAVHDDFTSLRGAVVESAAEPTTRPAAVSLGTRYPSRAVFVNPGPVSGTLQTQSLGTLAVSNVSTSELETGDYVVDDNLSFSTKALEYRPSYNLVQRSPTTVYENTLAYNRFENGYNGTLTGQSLVDGRSISLVVLAGNYSENGVGSATIDARAVSPATRTVAVTNEATDRPVTITVPTKLSAANWESILSDAGEFDGTGDTSNDAYVHDVREGPGDSVYLVMEEGATYDLRVGKVGVGSGVDAPSAHYLTVAETSQSSVTFEVRDRYNNPVSGATLNATALPSTTLSAQGQTGTGLTNLRTDPDGQVTVSLDSPTSGTYTLQASIDRDPTSEFDASRRQDADADVVVGGSGTGATGPYDVVWDRPAMDAAGGSAVTYYSSNDTLVVDSDSVSEFDGDVDVTDSDTGDPVSGVDVDFATNGSSVLTSGMGTDATDESGVATTTVSVSDGVATAYATAGGSFDTISVRIQSGSSGTDSSGACIDESGDGTCDDSEPNVTAEVEDGSYDAGSEDLVVENSVDDISSDTVKFSGGNVTIGPNVTATKNGEGENLEIFARNGDVKINGTVLRTTGSNSNIKINATGNIYADEAFLQAVDGSVILEADEDIFIRNATVDGTGKNKNDPGVVVNAGGTVYDTGVSYPSESP
ncbi:hypothetical protein [Haloferax profundi]|uniref:hypothetical protein n=1 Tax=Haloferax profundi TaxID=1544718 RepID=UPI000ADB610E|nr:hypothetical protein [Haloferax profundi]